MRQSTSGKFIGEILILILTLVLTAYTAIRNVHLIQMTFAPSDRDQAYLVLGALEGGLLIWVVLRMFAAQGPGQQGISVFMIVGNLVGIAVGVIVDTFLVSGQNGLTDKLKPDVAAVAIWVIAIVVVANVGMAIWYHLSSPAQKKRNQQEELRQAQDDLEFSLQKAAIDEQYRNAPALAAELAAHQSRQWIANERARAYSITGYTGPDAGLGSALFGNEPTTNPKLEAPKITRMNSVANRLRLTTRKTPNSKGAGK